MPHLKHTHIPHTLPSHISPPLQLAAVVPLLHTGSHAVTHDGQDGDQEPHEAQRHDTDQVLPVLAQVYAAAHQVVDRLEGVAEVFVIEG